MKENKGKCWFSSFCRSLYHKPLCFGRIMNHVLPLPACKKGDLRRNCAYAVLQSLFSGAILPAWNGENKAVPVFSLQPIPTSSCRCAEALGRLKETEKSYLPLGNSLSSFWRWEQQHPAATNGDVARHWALAWAFWGRWGFWVWVFSFGLGFWVCFFCNTRELNVFAIRLYCSCNLWQLWM